MKLFEIVNGWHGEAYVRCYAWADNEKQALIVAKEKFKEGKDTLEAEELFDSNSLPFCTKQSDCGWEKEKDNE